MLWKAAFPLEVLEQDNKPSTVCPGLIGQQFLFDWHQGKVVCKFLGGEILAHHSLAIGSGVGHNPSFVAPLRIAA
jgi:hypothetical protein